MRTVFIVVFCALLLFCGCNQTPTFKGDDLTMVKAATVVRDTINAYRRATLEFPQSLNELLAYLPPGESWPVNPYNGQPISDTGNSDFDVATSVGNVYYQQFFRDDVQTGFVLHIFGDKDKLVILSNSAFGAKE